MDGVFIGRPDALTDLAADLWEKGLPDTTPRAGDLWVLSWDGQTVGHVVLSAVRESFALVWPVTLPGEPAFRPGLTVPYSPLGIPVTMWPTRETGIGMFLLDRSLGQLLDPGRVAAISEALDDEQDPGYAFAAGNVSDDQNAQANVAMIEHWRRQCFNEGAVFEGQFLDSEKIKAHGGSSEAAAKALYLTPQALRPLWVGLDPASDEQVAVLAGSLGVEPSDITSADPWGETLETLARPAYKQDLKNGFEARGMTEGDLRLAVRSEYVLAARDDRAALNDQKLRDAIRRVGE